MEDLTKFVEQYIESKKGSWSPATMKSEGYRLSGVTEELLKEPIALYDYLKNVRNLKPYPLKTAFIRAGELVDFLIDKGHWPAGRNMVKLFMKEQANLFKHSYAKKRVALTFEEAVARVSSLKDHEVRDKAMQLLFTGMRYAESTTLKDGQVVGKGGYTRDIPLANDLPAEEYERSYTTLYRHLKTVGLTPHALRKLCATRLAASGAQEADLMKIMGWRSSAMASLYIQAEKEDQLMALMKKSIPKGSKRKAKGTGKQSAK